MLSSFSVYTRFFFFAGPWEVDLDFCSTGFGLGPVGFFGLGRSPDLDADLAPLDGPPFADFVGAIAFESYAGRVYCEWRISRASLGRTKDCQDIGERAVSGELGPESRVPGTHRPSSVGGLVTCCVLACLRRRHHSHSCFTTSRRSLYLPIAMSSERVFRLPFRKPQWLNSATTRTAGVYFAGALVRRPRHDCSSHS